MRHPALPVGPHLGSAEQVEGPAEATGDGVVAACSGDRRQHLPARLHVVEVERPEGARGDGVGRRFHPARNVDHVAHPRRSGKSDRLRQGWKRAFHDDPSVLPPQREHVGGVRLRVAPADAQHAVVHRQRGAVGAGCVEREAALPSLRTLGEHVDGIRPYFRAPLEQRHGKMGAARDDEHAVRDARARAGHAERLGQFGQRLPVVEPRRRQALRPGGRGGEEHEGRGEDEFRAPFG